MKHNGVNTFWNWMWQWALWDWFRITALQVLCLTLTNNKDRNFANVKLANFTYKCHFGSFFSSYVYVKKAVKMTFLRKIRTYNVDEIDGRTEILPTFYEHLFRTKVFWKAFMCLPFGYVIFWGKEIGAKADRKMLVKLTKRPKICHLTKQRNNWVHEKF